MRVITGTAKGVNLKTLTGINTRPTSAQVKEAIFSFLQFELEGAVVLDLFAGSGQLGIEALSRGAALAHFVERSPEAIAVIRENLAKTRLSEKAMIYRVPRNAGFRIPNSEMDIAFLDPPYHQGILPKVLPALAGKMKQGGVIVCEHEKEECLPNEVDAFKMDKTYHYGTIAVTVYRGGSLGNE